MRKNKVDGRQLSFDFFLQTVNCQCGRDDYSRKNDEAVTYVFMERKAKLERKEVARRISKIVRLADHFD